MDVELLDRCLIKERSVLQEVEWGGSGVLDGGLDDGMVNFCECHLESSITLVDSSVGNGSKCQELSDVLHGEAVMLSGEGLGYNEDRNKRKESMEDISRTYTRWQYYSLSFLPRRTILAIRVTRPEV